MIAGVQSFWFSSVFHFFFFLKTIFSSIRLLSSKCCTKSDRIQSTVVPSTYYRTSHPLLSSQHQCHKWGLACVLKWDSGWVRQAWLITASRISWMTESPNRFVSKLWTQPISGDYSFSYEWEKSNYQKQLKKKSGVSTQKREFGL